MTAQPAREGWRGEAARTYRVRVCALCRAVTVTETVTALALALATATVLGTVGDEGVRVCLCVPVCLSVLVSVSVFASWVCAHDSSAYCPPLHSPSPLRSLVGPPRRKNTLGTEVEQLLRTEWRAVASRPPKQLWV